jgi:hypothetical protein
MGALAFVSLVVLAGWLGRRALRRERDRIASLLRKVGEDGKGVTTLERDPATGVYRPRDPENRE